MFKWQSGDGDGSALRKLEMPIRKAIIICILAVEILAFASIVYMRIHRKPRPLTNNEIPVTLRTAAPIALHQLSQPESPAVRAPRLQHSLTATQIHARIHQLLLTDSDSRAAGAIIRDLASAKGPVVQIAQEEFAGAISSLQRERLHRLLDAVQKNYYPGELVTLNLQGSSVARAMSNAQGTIKPEWHFTRWAPGEVAWGRTRAPLISLRVDHQPFLQVMWKIQRLAYNAIREQNGGPLAPAGVPQREPAAISTFSDILARRWAVRCPASFQGAFAFLLTRTSFLQVMNFDRRQQKPLRTMRLHLTVVVDPSIKVAFSQCRPDVITQAADASGRSILSAPDEAAPLGTISPGIQSGVWFPVVLVVPGRFPRDGMISTLRGEFPVDISTAEKIVITNVRRAGQSFHLRDGDTFIYKGINRRDVHFVIHKPHGDTQTSIDRISRLIVDSRIEGIDKAGNYLWGAAHDVPQYSPATGYQFESGEAALSSTGQPAHGISRLIITLYPTTYTCEVPFEFKNVPVPKSVTVRQTVVLKPTTRRQWKKRGVYQYRSHPRKSGGLRWTLNGLSFFQQARYEMPARKMNQWCLMRFSVSRPQFLGFHADVAQARITNLVDAGGRSQLLTRPRAMTGPRFNAVPLSGTISGMQVVQAATPPEGGQILQIAGDMPVSIRGTPRKLPQVIFPAGRWSKPIKISSGLYVTVKSQRMHVKGLNPHDRSIEMRFAPRADATVPIAFSRSAQIVMLQFLHSGNLVVDGIGGGLWGMATLRSAAKIGPFTYQFNNVFMGALRPPVLAKLSYHEASVKRLSKFDFRNIPWR